MRKNKWTGSEPIWPITGKILFLPEKNLISFVHKAAFYTATVTIMQKKNYPTRTNFAFISFTFPLAKELHKAITRAASQYILEYILALQCGWGKSYRWTSQLSHSVSQPSWKGGHGRGSTRKSERMG